MNVDAYRMVRMDPDGAAVGLRNRSLLCVTGRDARTFLNGQVSNDVLHLETGQGLHACLLNNTGHMLANLFIHSVGDDVFIVEVNRERGDVVRRTLERFIIRERVEIEDISSARDMVTVQGRGAGRVAESALRRELPENASLPLANISAQTARGSAALIVQHSRTPARSGFDFIVPAGEGAELVEALLLTPQTAPLDDETLAVLRVEAGIPKWGFELDESILPLEANLYSAINQNKGCYMGQEVIARILSRGHTNRTLVGFRLAGAVERGTALRAQGGDESRSNPDVGRLTSVVVSPELGPIALGYLRNEHAKLGSSLTAGETTATVTALPFVSG